MGLFGKIKNIFYDEEIVEVPEKEEEKPRIEEVIVPKRENEPIKTETTFSERELFKSEPTFKFPVVDEEDEVVPEKPRPNLLKVENEVRRNVPVTPRRESPVNSRFEPKHEEPVQKSFTPSPVISPIYGILDKNYKKEQIIENTESINNRPLKNVDINYDTVRRKAYGTLEDELENTLTKMSNDVLESVEELENDINNIPNKSIEDLLTEIESNANVSIGELEEQIKDREEKEELRVEKKEKSLVEEEAERVTEEINFKRVKDEVGDKTLEHDLFNLIDSMYEEKEGE